MGEMKSTYYLHSWKTQKEEEEGKEEKEKEKYMPWEGP